MRLANNRLDFERYAIGYDRLCDLSPAYQDLRALLKERIPTFCLPERPRVCELGAGTGNFTLDIAEQYPAGSYTHVDMSSQMNHAARLKYKVAGIEDVEVVESYVQTCEFPENEFDLVIIVNALNTCPPQFQVMQNIQRWLKPGGHLFIIDFGREQDTWDWTLYLSKTVYESQGFFGLMRELWKNREAIRQNRRARYDQEHGNMWLHTTDEFGEMVCKAGFKIKHLQSCYRDYSDLVVAQKPLHSPHAKP